MKTTDQIDHFAKDLDRLVERYAMEYELPMSAVIGTLQIKCVTLIQDESDGSE